MHVVVHVNNIYLDFTELPNRYTFTDLIPIPQLSFEPKLHVQSYQFLLKQKQSDDSLHNCFEITTAFSCMNKSLNAHVLYTWCLDIPELIKPYSYK